MKIKIIDLLNLVYENKAPKKVLYKYCEYEFNYIANDYENNDGLELFSYLFQNEEQVLWLEVEIIEERPKEISKIMLEKGNIEIGSIVNELEFPNHDLELLANCIEGMIIAWNESADTFNYLLKKEDSK